MGSLTAALAVLLLALPALAAPPSNLTATLVPYDQTRDSRVQLRWEDNEQGELGYVIERQLPNEPWAIVGSCIQGYPPSGGNPCGDQVGYLDRTDNLNSFVTRRNSGPQKYRVLSIAGDGSRSVYSNEATVDVVGFYSVPRITLAQLRFGCDEAGSFVASEFAGAEPPYSILFRVGGRPWEISNGWNVVARDTQATSFSHNPPAEPGQIVEYIAVESSSITHHTGPPFDLWMIQPWRRGVVPDCPARHFVLHEPTEHPTTWPPAGEVSFEWENADGALNYSVQIREFGRTDWVSAHDTEETEHIRPLSVNGLPFDVRVMATLADGVVFSNERHVKNRNWITPAKVAYLSSSQPGFSGGFALPGNGRFSTVDVSDSAHPRLLASIESQHLANGVGVALTSDERYAFVGLTRGNAEFGCITTVRIENPRQPEVVGEPFCDEALRRPAVLEMYGTDLIVSTRLAGLVYIDASNPEALRRVAWDKSRWLAGMIGFHKNGGIVYAAANSMWGTSLSDTREGVPYTSVMWSQYVVATGPDDCFKRGRYVYCEDDSSSFLVLDFEDPIDPIAVGITLHPHMESSGLVASAWPFSLVLSPWVVAGGRASLLSLSDPVAPRVLATLDGFSGATDAKVRHSLGFVRTADGIVVLALDPRSFRELGRLSDPRLGSPSGMALGYRAAPPPPRPPFCGLGFEAALALVALGLLRGRRGRK